MSERRKKNVILDILEDPNPVLHTPCEEAVPGPETTQLLMDMIETLQAHENGVGLAAPQVGHAIRAFVMGTTEQGFIGILNPRITKRSGVKVKSTEGCLSVPGKTVVRKRAASVTVRGQNANGLPVEFSCAGQAACVVQHELDHLDGLTIAS